MSTTLTPTDLFRITSELWSAVLGLELVEDVAAPAPDPATTVVEGAVQITGDVTGAVVVQLTAALARRAAAAMFALEPDEVSDEEVADTVGELANVVGGNVKALVGGRCQLSLPSVTSGRDFQVAILRATPIERLTASCDGEPVVVTLFTSP